eukprot:SAG31_NODE_1045_length_10180_cov_5.454221_10_plen_66_part_00
MWSAVGQQPAAASTPTRLPGDVPRGGGTRRARASQLAVAQHASIVRYGRYLGTYMYAAARDSVPS